jgi:hypothetical protein
MIDAKIVGQRPSGAKVLIDINQLVVFQKAYVIVDSGFLSTREVTLTTGFITNSDNIYVNGLLLKDDNYTIASDTLTFNAGLEIEVGDNLDIRYATQ